MATTTEERELAIKTLRETSIKDTEREAGKQRFALFSQPPPLAVGDDSVGQKRFPPRDDNTGKPIVAPRNIQVAAPKQGKSASSFFSLQGFTTIGDAYVDPERQRRLDELQKKASITNEAIFKPATGYKTIISSSYKHPDKAEFPEQKKNYRDSDGKVRISPHNVVTNPGAKDLFKFRKHIPDPFGRERELAKKEREQHYAKIGEKAPFKSTIHGHRNFSPDRLSYGIDKPMPPKKPFKEPQLNILKHEVPFKPSHPPKSGFEGYLNKFPDYKEDPIRQVKRIDKEKEKDVFKPNHGGNLTRPTVTISCHPINIRREMANISHRL